MLNFDYNADMLGELLLRLQGVQTGATRDAALGRRSILWTRTATRCPYAAT